MACCWCKGGVFWRSASYQTLLFVNMPHCVFITLQGKYFAVECNCNCNNEVHYWQISSLCSPAHRTGILFLRGCCTSTRCCGQVTQVLVALSYSHQEQEVQANWIQHWDADDNLNTSVDTPEEGNINCWTLSSGWSSPRQLKNREDVATTPSIE